MCSGSRDSKVLPECQSAPHYALPSIIVNNNNAFSSDCAALWLVRETVSFPRAAQGGTGDLEEQAAGRSGGAGGGLGNDLFLQVGRRMSIYAFTGELVTVVNVESGGEPVSCGGRVL